jgi:hypothetical protein
VLRHLCVSPFSTSVGLKSLELLRLALVTVVLQTLGLRPLLERLGNRNYTAANRLDHRVAVPATAV